MFDINAIEAELCRRSFYYFVQKFWEVVIHEKPVWNWHIKYLCDELQQIGERVKERLPKLYDYYIINIPPGSSKSTICSEMYPLWVWTIDPSQRFICGSYASTPAEDIAGKCYTIYTSDLFKKLFPHLVGPKKSGGKTNFKNGLLGERYTTSTGSAITGIHAHQLIIDDPMSPKIARSKTERERANTWISETISSRKVDIDISVTIIIMQRLHENDTTGYLLKKEGIRVKHICIPAELSSDVRPAELAAYYKDGLFDPVRKGVDALRFLRDEYGSYGYAGQMMQRPSPQSGGIVKKSWFEIVERNNFTPTQLHFQLDTAYTQDTNNDPSAVIAYYIEGGRIYIKRVCSVYKEFPDFIKWLPTYVKDLGYSERSIIYVEPKASGKSIVQQLRATTNLNIKEDEAPKVDKLSRLNSVTTKLETGRVVLHSGGWNEDFLDQLASFPNAEHDDEVDCLVAIVKRHLIDLTGIPPRTLAGMLH